MNKTLLRFMGLVVLVGSNGCLPTYDPSSPKTTLPPAQSSGPQGSGTDVSNNPVAVQPANPADGVTVWNQNGDPALVAAAQQNAGPIALSARQHSCMKMKFDTLGRMLSTHGVNMAAGGTSILPVTASTNCNTLTSGTFTTGEAVSYLGQVAQPAAFVYCDAALTLGMPQYAARIAEPTAQSTASGTKLYDVFASAAVEIEKNLGSTAACMVNGQAATLFTTDASGNVSCNEPALTCMQGYPATVDQVALCTRAAQQSVATPAQTVVIQTFQDDGNGGTVLVSSRNLTVPGITATETGKQLAIAAVLSAVHSCE
jgi:hypothetical protein